MSAPPLKKSVLTCESKRRHPDEFTARGWHLTSNMNGPGRLVTADNPVHEGTRR